MKQKILITSALLYANGPLHFGHIAGAYLPGDCYARFQRLQGNDVLYVCGSDEYGVAITLSAKLAGRSPQDHVNLFHKINKDLFEKLQISFDHFSRTTCPSHKAPVQQYFKDLYENGYIEPKVTDQLYSKEDDRFLADRYVIGTCPACGYESARGDECQKCGASYEATDLKNPRSKLSNAPLTLKPTKHWFLLLDKMRDQLLQWIETKNLKSNVVRFVKNYIEGLRPRAITRDERWGVPIPLEETDGKVLYVWFDAPIGYISASMEWAEKKGDPEAWKSYWLDQKTKLVHFIGKDNIPFHAVIFPAMTMGQNTPYKLVDELPANEFLNLEGHPFSKSEDWTIDFEDFFKHYTTDQIRYTLAANAPETADADFSWKEFQGLCNTDLLGKYGNLGNRTLVFAKNNCDGKIPSEIVLEKKDQDFLQEIQNIAKEAAKNYEEFSLRKASRKIMELSQKGNVYFDSKQPWKAAKSPDTHTSMLTTISCCIECLKTLALISSPIIPETAQKLWELIGMQTNLSKQNWDEVLNTPLSPNQLLPKPELLFQKIEDDQIEKEVAKLHQKIKKEESPINYPPLKDEITFDEFQKIDLRVAIIKEATAVPKSKKLLQLTVDLGFETRSLVAGISQYYTPDELIGKKVVVVANLKPAKLMGIESQGMVLAGKLDKALEVASFTNLEPGGVVN